MARPKQIKESTLEADYRALNTYKVNLADLRMQIVELMKDGFKEVPLGDLLYIIRHM